MGVKELRYSRDEFVKAINEIENCVRFNERMNAAGAATPYGYYIDFCYPDCTFELADALSRMYDDDSEAVAYFCFEINFGAEYKDGDNMYGGKEWPLRDAGELYDFLAEQAKYKG